MKLVMTLLVRNEEDILVMNLEHHLRQGVDFFIVTNNCSVDSTSKILQTYVDRGLMEVIDEPSDTYAQAVWVTRMAQRAVQLSADWIFHADADEFWVATQPGCLLRDVIPELSYESPLWNVDRWNAALHVGDDEQDWINPALVKFLIRNQSTSMDILCLQRFFIELRPEYKLLREITALFGHLLE